MQLQLRGTDGRFRRLKTVSGTAARGYVETTFAANRSGLVRLAWSSQGRLLTSRAVSFRVIR